ncbi:MULTISPECIES: MraY family glycosyltransferase [Olivibacter]|uniref:UDP-GlcNAc--UDP-phosphate GlcNAc-1-phosphate transferase n=1 Tax=Olivibacter jilunii TaxID=985016 RepID=A0ABW6BA71_9SPHI|nr:UDP-GlcNAc--UDP-phosphate GlcNAc-1-phosphate transferase [Olivibacter sp. UJ_SKK_5.1]MDX3912666.1 UDP-GlcNAc--UDP-phosphate GlcNAc-1-phosphate transferase [Pseudosphingobacterium sp.]
MIYFYLFCFLFLVISGYFRLAEHFNIIDKPNQRSSHTLITIRGGGVIFYFAALFYFFWSGYRYPFFFIGLSLMAFVSFLDDIYTLSNKLRIVVHLISVAFLLHQLDFFQQSWPLILVAAFVIIGVINAYNFMDGINGITAAYSFVIIWLLWLANEHYDFIDDQLLYFLAIGNLVFFYFNFRNKAKCFAGDVGSVSMSFILIYALFLLIIKAANPIYLLFLSVYGIDVVTTIGIRLLKRENIFKAHRMHLYQYLGNEAGLNRLMIAFFYSSVQLFIGFFIIWIAGFSVVHQLLFSVFLLLILASGYATLRWYVYRKYVQPGIKN